MKKLLKKGTPECDFHNELFALHQNFGQIEDKPEFWEACIVAVNEIADKYKNTPMQKFVYPALIGFTDYLDALARKEKHSPRTIAGIVCAGRETEEIAKIIKEMEVMK